MRGVSQAEEEGWYKAQELSLAHETLSLMMSTLKGLRKRQLLTSEPQCDQNKPACSRCTRLQIPCVGCGQQRYRFKNQTLSPKSCRPHQSVPFQTFAARPVPLALTNSTTRVAGGLVSALGVTDIRYELNIYGDFLKDIPRRLGRNAALDSSVAALTTSFEAVHTGRQTPEVFEKYAKALHSLRLCLDDPIEAQSPETLCAIWMVVICQVCRIAFFDATCLIHLCHLSDCICTIGLDRESK